MFFSSRLMSKHSIANLPIPSATKLLLANLTPDTHTPSPGHFLRSVLTTNPSIQRRARLLSPSCHFSFVTPFPIPFPYDIDPPGPDEQDKYENDKSGYIEKWLTEREAVHPRNPNSRLYDAKNRDQPAILLGLSESGLRDCFPHLDVGDAFALLGAPSLTAGEEGQPSDNDQARQELIDVLSGKSVLMSDDFAPWSVRYSGHQFGSWAGQLGDGRATSILVSTHPTTNTIYELQLKGAGRTPFSRTADGLAVIRSSIREYLASEHMHALRIPTTRSLSLIALPSLPVHREQVEKASIMSRIAPSFLRIGNFEALNAPTGMFFFGGGQQEKNLEALRVLGEWVKGPGVLGLPLKEGEAWGKELVLEVGRRNARMVAKWQGYGFMHGVINTDNVSLLGLTIDYGPYAFMDVFDRLHICNHTDESGRYAYKYQPSMIVYALRKLAEALAPIVGAEIESGKAVTKGWAEGVKDEKVEEWTKAGVEATKDDMERVVQEVMSEEYAAVMRGRLGLLRPTSTDESTLSKPLLDLMEEYQLDFHATFRVLGWFKPSLLAPDQADKLAKFIDVVLGNTPDSDRMKASRERAEGDLRKWLNVYAERIRSEADLWKGEIDEARKKSMHARNPRFVLRQWVLEEVIKGVERDMEEETPKAGKGTRVLAKVMHMGCNPYEPWGGEVDPLLEAEEEELDEEEKEERRFCGLGEKRYLGFQCSCSS